MPAASAQLARDDTADGGEHHDGRDDEHRGCRSRLLRDVTDGRVGGRDVQGREDVPEPEEFLNNLCLKAGLPADYWKDLKKVELWEYTAETFQEGEELDKIKG